MSVALRGSLTLKRILDAANGVLNFALDLIHHAFVLELLVPGQLAGTLFDFAAQVRGRAFDAILVYEFFLLGQNA